MKKFSPSLQNIIDASMFIAASRVYPEAPKNSAFALINNIQVLDEARKQFYGHDEESLKIFDWIARYRIVMSLYGDKYALLLPGAPYTNAEWRALEQRALAMTSGFVEGDYLLDRIDTWILESYSLKGKCEAQEGDVVLDCGSYTGNTCKYFSQKVGPGGHVYGIEPLPESYEILKKNMLGLSNVTTVNAAVLNTSGPVSLNAAGFGTSINSEPSGVMAYGLTIDSLVDEYDVDRVDFIKMDVEGAENVALYGAENVIKKYTPRMALSAYHIELDIVELPKIVLQLNSKYKFALRHFSNCAFETVLYCYTE